MNVLRKLVSFLCISACLFSLVISVCADPLIDPRNGEAIGEVYPETDTLADPEVIPDDSTLSYPDVVEEDFSNTGSFDLLSDPLDGSASVYANAPIESGDTSGLKAVLLDILGPYEPILFTYSYGTNSTAREVFQDDVWLCSFWLLAIMVFCLFRMIGGWLSRKK